MQKQKERGTKTDETVEEMPEAKKADLTDIDKLLDEIEEVLEDPAQAEIAKLSFKEKIRSIGFARGRGAPCSELVRVPRGVAEAMGLEHYDGPPCVDC